MNVFIITFATLIKNNGRNRDYDEVLSTYSHIHVYHDPLGLMDSICVST
ncbi:signal recognition particle [Bacteroides thetaiotaomicron]|uniref:Signal recognition particle n=1 Tax=Bacteroides thetaiotaomicron TaxID=818 RepID=A0A2J6A9V3_BACT4|nr:signal recognition particle [Bacteroides thetaiotaomicron]KAA5262161.1 signal recognition particle [Bacteroides faecis]RGC84186.1 signal recognition particle [Bacteroides sp. AM23-12]KAA0100152.1 signal recognition particle [Bacteroides thetaiotaomicron]KAA5267708.1 signal recognition particle [Bacteroides faecis]